jgi:hypothetical protein
MDNVQKTNYCANEPSSGTFRSYLSFKMKYVVNPYGACTGLTLDLPPLMFESLLQCPSLLKEANSVTLNRSTAWYILLSTKFSIVV